MTLAPIITLRYKIKASIFCRFFIFNEAVLLQTGKIGVICLRHHTHANQVQNQCLHFGGIFITILFFFAGEALIVFVIN